MLLANLVIGFIGNVGLSDIFIFFFLNFNLTISIISNLCKQFYELNVKLFDFI